jgi:predicted metal-dependent hydrolase
MVFFSKKKDLEYPKFIYINNLKYEIKVDFFQKKSSSVREKNKVLYFRLSSNLNSKNAEVHFNSLLKNIVKKIKNNNVSSDEKNINYFLELGYFYFANERFEINFLKMKSIKLEGNSFYINPKLKIESIEKKIISLLIDRYYLRFKNYVYQINNNSYNYIIRDFYLKDLKSKWGHCTHDNKILLNLKLLNFEKEVIDYVIYHELAHIKVKNHSLTFWKEVERFCPNHRVLRKKLKSNSISIFKEK